MKSPKKLLKKEKIKENSELALRERAITAIKQVVDPELGIDVWTLGLIYNIQTKKDDDVYIKMTFTSIMCPYGPELEAQVKTRLLDAGFRNVIVEITFDPPWQPTDELREMLGLPV